MVFQLANNVYRLQYILLIYDVASKIITKKSLNFISLKFDPQFFG